MILCAHCGEPAVCEVEVTPPWLRYSERCHRCATNEDPPPMWRPLREDEHLRTHLAQLLALPDVQDLKNVVTLAHKYLSPEYVNVGISLVRMAFILGQKHELERSVAPVVVAVPR